MRLVSRGGGGLGEGERKRSLVRVVELERKKMSLGARRSRFPEFREAVVDIQDNVVNKWLLPL